MRLVLAIAGFVLAALAAPTSAAATLLYDQTDSVAPNWSPSDQFQSGQEQFDTETADDFSIPAGEVWTIAEVDVIGKFGAAVNPPPQVNVRLYADGNHLPGSLLFSSLGIAAANGPNYSITLTGTRAMVRGKYWISVQQTGAVVPSMGDTIQWLWQARTFQSGDPAALRDSNCPNWGVRMSCRPGILAPDQLFRLGGDVISNRFKFGKPKRKPNGSSVVPANFPSPGKVVVADARTAVGATSSAVAKPRIKRKALRVGAGKTNLPIKPNRRSKKKLNEGLELKVNVKVTYTPSGYISHSQTKRIKLKKQL